MSMYEFSGRKQLPDSTRERFAQRGNYAPRQYEGRNEHSDGTNANGGGIAKHYIPKRRQNFGAVEETKVAEKEPVKMYDVASVEISALAFTKIIRHCAESSPVFILGQLLGSIENDVFRLTDCFPSPTKRDIVQCITKERLNSVTGNQRLLPDARDVEERVEEECELYVDSMTRLISDVNIDCFTIGWYQTAVLGDFSFVDIIENFYYYRATIETPIMILFDTVAHSLGMMPLRAYKLNAELLNKSLEGEATALQLNNYHSLALLTQVPIVVQNNLFSELFLAEWVSADTNDNSDFCSLSLDNSKYFSKGINFTSHAIDLLESEQENIISYTRNFADVETKVKQEFEKQKKDKMYDRKDEKREMFDFNLPNNIRSPEFPSQLRTMLLNHQVASLADDVNNYIAETNTKVKLVNAVTFPN